MIVFYNTAIGNQVEAMVKNATEDIAMERMDADGTEWERRGYVRVRVVDPQIVAIITEHARDSRLTIENGEVTGAAPHPHPQPLAERPKSPRQQAKDRLVAMADDEFTANERDIMKALNLR
jgi:hypothetical protein